MTNPTPHGQVPEALRLADLLLNLQMHMGPRRPSHPDDAHCWDGYTQSSAELRRLHAENEALRKAHVQTPAEIEHVAGDVSKNGAESNMAQQPATSAAAAPTVPRYTIEDMRQARRESYEQGVASAVPQKVTPAMRAAFREAYKDGSVWTDRLDRAVEAMLAAAPQHSPTPQADSVLEDAARYRYLRDGDWREHEKLESVIRLQLNALWDETIDAARKQGANHA